MRTSPIKIRSVTIRDVATEAGYSVATVSNVLRGGQGHVYPEATYTKIRETAERLGYKANAAARLMRQSNRTLIGMPLELSEHPYLSRFLLAAHDELVRHEYEPVFLKMSYISGKGDSEPFPPLQMLAGMVTVGLELQREWPAAYDRLPPQCPVVALQPVAASLADRVAVVQVDYEDAYCQVFEHLLALGHRNIAFLNNIGIPRPSDTAKNDGWFRAAQRYGVSPRFVFDWGKTVSAAMEESVVEEGVRSDYIYHPNTHRALTKLIEQLTGTPDRVTALVCSGDEIAIGIQSYLQAHGWNLPEQLSIVGYDGISFGEYVYPSLTTLAPDYSAMASEAVRRILNLLAPSPGNIPTAASVVKPQLIVRASTAPPAHA